MGGGLVRRIRMPLRNCKVTCSDDVMVFHLPYLRLKPWAPSIGP